MRSVAAATGGIAYYCRHDLDVALREAMDDARVSYTLGFYQSSDDSRSAIHRIGVRVTRPGVALRFRTTYVAEPARQAAPDPVADLVQALNRPVDSSAIPVRASVNLTGNMLSVETTLDAQRLDLVQDQNLWKGTVEVLARFITADGVVAGDILHQTLTLNLHEATRDAAMRDGLPWRNTFSVPARAVELRLLFANPATGKIGTLTIPLAGDEQTSISLSPGTPIRK